ncbi:hexose kinase [Vagococcus elongatus]|uniref:Tagatose-6-phosphate kinase n=1 Tax=Vagococcus elongatus TaxID=180344 RepID=A0A430AY84_9ENTE|nr:hexose kinase [Vagococcus elongatus]RSU13009.1 tagatose-6-phosphate kinase [Vagococcus elongatus]
MILTVTMNPSVDISYKLEQLKIDTVNRCENYSKTAGGKGLNVTRVIHQMGHQVTATGLLGGALGRYIEDKLSSEGIAGNFYPISGETRNCIAILHDNGKQTEVLEKGPVISAEEGAGFLKQFSQLLDDANVVTISGSLPEGISPEVYIDIIRKTHEAGKKVILDTSGSTLATVLTSGNKPYAIKPNLEEIQGIVHETIDEDNVEDIKGILSNELFADIPLIVISLGAKGAFVKFEDAYYDVVIPKIKVVNPVGSGDASVGGLAIGLSKELAIEDILKTSMTLGMLNTMEEKTGHVNPVKFQDIFDLIKVTKV